MSNQEADSSVEESDGYLVYDEFIVFYRKVAVRKEIVDLFSNVSKNGHVITPEQLLSFMKSKQEMVSIS